jgi:hypothetical protein
MVLDAKPCCEVNDGQNIVKGWIPGDLAGRSLKNQKRMMLTFIEHSLGEINPVRKSRLPYRLMKKRQKTSAP